MALKVNRLTDRAARAANTKGLISDGGGLLLQVSATGSKSWIFRFKRNGRARDMGLGAFNDGKGVSLAEARDLAAQARRQLREGKDPIEAREAQRDQQRLAAARSATFQDCAEQLFASYRASWRSAKHAAQWRTTLVTYAYPVLGGMPVTEIDTALVLRVLEPIWATKTETASRVRGRIEAVLSWAKARGMCAGENPAQWRGHLDQLLPARSKVRRVAHLAALPYQDMPAFMARLRAGNGIAARGLEFLILTAARTGEALGAQFSELDLAQRMWTVPAERMKGGREHRVPLSPRAFAIVQEMAAIRLSAFAFPGLKPGKPLNPSVPLGLLRELHPSATTHGFRSAFKDWASETTSFPDHVSEAALAHASADRVRAAYARSDLFQKRRELMDAWAVFCGSTVPDRLREAATPVQRR